MTDPSSERWIGSDRGPTPEWGMSTHSSQSVNQQEQEVRSSSSSSSGVKKPNLSGRAHTLHQIPERVDFGLGEAAVVRWI